MIWVHQSLTWTSGSIGFFLNIYKKVWSEYLRYIRVVGAKINFGITICVEFLSNFELEL